MKIYTQKKDCCGCGGCMQICSRNAIEMIQDDEGFAYPNINSERCIECGLCENVCPIKNVSTKNDDVLGSYVGYAKNDNIRMNSSSGGVFSLLAENIISDDGVVYGAAFDESFSVHHIGIDCIEDLRYLRGSKYLQSRTENTFKEVKVILENGRKVLYTGTACQIAGLKQYLNKEYKDLITVDVLCHGVPSPKVWDYYLEKKRQENNTEIRYINFRNKRNGWKKFEVKIDYLNSNKYEKVYSEDPYMLFFLEEMCLRPSCHNCLFKKLERPTDLTIGDCWGIENYMKQMDDDKGTSVIFTHTKKGEEMLKSIWDKMKICKGEKDSLLSPNADSRKSVVAHPNRKLFFELLNKNASIDELIKIRQISYLKKIKNLFFKLFK